MWVAIVAVSGCCVSANTTDLNRCGTFHLACKRLGRTPFDQAELELEIIKQKKAYSGSNPVVHMCHNLSE